VHIAPCSLQTQRQPRSASTNPLVKRRLSKRRPTHKVCLPSRGGMPPILV
jgi:hypothetical protein